MTPEILAEVLEGPIPVNAQKVLDTASEFGWWENPYTSLVIRLTKEEAEPFFCRWDLFVDPETGKRSWRFAGARAANGQPLNYNDIFIYLQDPSVIYPESEEEDDDND